METVYDCGVIGGGLAGLTLSINLSKQGFRVILFEKETYPFHKVCGEYISMESFDYLAGLGVPLNDLSLPLLKKLVLTSPAGNELQCTLQPGGFGISRYMLDGLLKEIAVRSGVTVIDDCKVENAILNNAVFNIATTKGNFMSKACCGSFGKRSSLDIKWKRPFTMAVSGKLNNYIAVKYHVKTNLDADTISLHNFKNGYCGISKIEGDKFCLCYLTNAANLKGANNSIREMEDKVLKRNPHLKKLFDESEKLYLAPLTISSISFEEKSQVENHVLMIGDAAGLITPLCGNGMSMAMHAGKIAAHYIALFLTNKIARSQLESLYAAEWKKTFSKRILAGRIIQKMFGKIWLTSLFIKMMKLFPSLTKMIIRQTHGKPF